MTAATDPMGQAAHKASTLTDGLFRELLIASSPFASRLGRKAALERALSTWPKLCRAMAELEKAAPNSATTGAAEDAKCVDFMEGRRGA
jgi:hypothetical protein